MKRRLIVFRFLVIFGIVLGLMSEVQAGSENEPSGTEKDTTAIATDTVAIDTLVLMPDDPILVVMDSLMQATYFNANPLVTDTVALNKYCFAADSVPQYPDSVYKARLAALNAETPFDLRYNDKVKAFIALYADRRRELTSRVLGLSHTYFPLFEEQLDRYNLPLELKYLAIVESALQPNARSRSGAVGLWQFMYSTGKMYDLKVTSYVDERSDPYQSTVAACKFLKLLYKMYGDWDLALAAYNCGPGNVNKAIRRSGGKRGYWEIYDYLPRETRGYVPAFIAVNYVMNHAAEHNLYPVEPHSTYFAFDTVKIDKQVTFEQLSAVLEIPKEQLKNLNPQYRKNLIPDVKESMTLCLPNDKLGLFLQNEDTIYAYRSPKQKEEEEKAILAAKEERKVHVVRPGECLGLIAQNHGVSVTNIKTWNGLRSARINPGQKLVVYVSGEAKKKSPASAVAKAPAKKTTAPSGKYVYYQVQQGDTLWDISKSQGVTLKELQRLNGTLDAKRLKPGAKIIVGTNS